MPRAIKTKVISHVTGTIQFSVMGLAAFSATLIVATGLLTGYLLTRRPSARSNPFAATENSSSSPRSVAETPACGELVTYDIDLEQPEEYVAFDLGPDTPPQWVFSGWDRPKVRKLMLGCGMSHALADRALSDQLAKSSPTGTTVFPDAALVLALDAKVRSKLYAALAYVPANHYMQYPFCYPRDTFQRWFGDGTKDEHLIALVRKLLYPRGDGLCFSDYELVLRHSRSAAERFNLVKALSRQSAVLVRLRVRPESDIDKLLGYWSRGVQIKDARPLLESVARLPDGGTVSLLYLLPKFARERLYTFPMPSATGQPVMDCHWSTMNFLNDPPSNLFTNLTYMASLLSSNYYPVGKPTSYGDILLLQDPNGQTIHSAIYLAEDIVFTKNGVSLSQPWMLMRLADLRSRYTADAPPKMLVYRSRSFQGSPGP